MSHGLLEIIHAYMEAEQKRVEEEELLEEEQLAAKEEFRRHKAHTLKQLEEATNEPGARIVRAMEQDEGFMSMPHPERPDERLYTHRRYMDEYAPGWEPVGGSE